MATYQPFAGDLPFDESEWLELLGTVRPGGQDTITNKGSDATVVVLIDAARMRAAATWCLGYAWADDDSPWEMHRETPVSHSFWGTQLRCTSVSFQPFSPAGNADNLDGKPYVTTDVGTAGIERYANYDKAWMTVKFGPKPYLMYEDDDPEWSGLESDRFCTKYTIDAQLDIISADADRSLIFQEGPLVGQPFGGSVGERITQTVYGLTWHEVPRSFVCDDTGRPLKIEACTGRVNSTDFLGFPAGTLLLLAPKYEPGMWSYYSVDGRPLYYDITFPFLYFDPTTAAGSALARGHNLMPVRVGGPNGGPTWSLATRKDASGNDTGPTGPRLIESADFNTLFTHVLS